MAWPADFKMPFSPKFPGTNGLKDVFFFFLVGEGGEGGGVA